MRGGLRAALDRARSLGVDAVEIYSRNPLRAVPRRIGKASIRRYLEEGPHYPLYLACPFWYNPASPAAGTRAMTRQALLEDCALAARLNAELLVLYPGRSVEGPPQRAAERTARMLLDVLSHAPVRIALENPAGAGTQLGSRIEEMAWILEGLPRDRVGMCINIANFHLAGYDVTSDDGWLSLCDAIEHLIGWDRVWLCHVTDTPARRGSRRESYCNVGEGYIGQRGLRALGIFDPFLMLPKIVVPPRTNDLVSCRVNVTVARACL